MKAKFKANLSILKDLGGHMHTTAAKKESFKLHCHIGLDIYLATLLGRRFKLLRISGFLWSKSPATQSCQSAVFTRNVSRRNTCMNASIHRIHITARNHDATLKISLNIKQKSLRMDNSRPRHQQFNGMKTVGW